MAEEKETFHEFYLANYKKLVQAIGHLQEEKTNRIHIPAEDIAQDCFCLALVQWETLKSHPNPAGWLFQTAKYMLNNQNRKKENQAVSYEQRGADSVSTGSDCAFEIVDIAIFLEELLPNADLEILYQYYISGYSLTEIACKFGLNENTARVKLMRIRKKIKGNWMNEEMGGHSKEV